MAIKSEREKLREAIADNLYWEMCRNCPNAKRCHEDCEECDEYAKELYKQLKACKVNEPYEEPFLEESEEK